MNGQSCAPTLSDSKVMWESHTRVTPKCLKHPSGSRSRSQGHTKAPCLLGPEGIRLVQCWVLHDPHRGSWHRFRERRQTVYSPYSSHPVLGLAVVQGGDVLTLSQSLGYSSEVGRKHRQLIKIQCGENSNEELNFRMLLIQKLVNNEKEKNYHHLKQYGWMQKIIFKKKFRERQIWYHLYIDSKNNMNKSVHKIEIDSETQKTNLPKGIGRQGGTKQKYGIRGPRNKLPTSAGSWKKQESYRKTSISALLTMPKTLTVRITINWKILKVMGPDAMIFIF